MRQKFYIISTMEFETQYFPDILIITTFFIQETKFFRLITILIQTQMVKIIYLLILNTIDIHKC